MKLRYISSLIAPSLLTVMMLSSTSCKKYVDVGVSPNLVSTTQAFNSDASATSTIVSLYSYYPTTSGIRYASVLGGISSDEMQYTSSDASVQQFAQDALVNTNSYSENYLWSYAYQVVRETNLAINGINSSASISAAAKSQLLGEAKFMRAFTYFYLVNFFGGVPLSLDPVELNNATLPRATTQAVYTQIITDLKDAVNLLPANYAGIANFKARPNKWAAAALLARVYLYNKDYVNAEALSTQVIGSGTYTLPAPSSAFINTSPEVILQFATQFGYSIFGSPFGAANTSTNVVLPTYALYPNFTKLFEKGDTRKTNWVDSLNYNGTKYYRIAKYKLATATAGNEYNVVLRLAEQYLIRAEARAQQGNIAGAQADINVVRTRAGLPNTTAATQGDLLTAIAAERKVELFGELAHRWFDLKRTGQTGKVLSPLKPTYKATSDLFPIPYSQLLINPALNQNPGY